MDLNYVNDFLVLSASSNLSEAADVLSISESSLSRHIKALEDELGCTLFDRTPRNFRLNRYGKIFLSFAAELMEVQKRAKTVLSDAQVREKSSVPIVSNYYVNDFLLNFTRSHTSIQVSLLDSPNDDDALFDKLKSGECSFAFIANYQAQKGKFSSFPVARDSYVAVLPRNHALAGRQRIRLEELADDNFISFQSGCYDDQVLRGLCRKAGFEPRIILTGDVGSVIAGFVRDELGVSVLKHDVLLKVGVRADSVAMIPLDPPADIIVSMVWKTDSVLTPAERTFFDACKKQARENGFQV